MAKIKILHLSDLHFDSSNPKDTEIVLNALWKDLENFKDIDFILFSGDLVKAGDKKDDFDKAYQSFIKPLLEKTNLDESNFFIAPGNHDIQRDAIDEIIEEGLKARLSDRESLNSFLDTQLKKGFIHIERLNHFNDFKTRFIAGSTITSTKLFSTHKVNKQTVNIGISCLNSCWRATGIGSGHDKGRLLIGERQIDASLNDLKDCHVKIAVCHHPLDWLAEYDQSDAEKRLSTKFDFLFCGHLHNANLKLVQNFENQRVLVQSGCLYESRSFYNGYSVMCFDTEEGEGIIYLRSYFDYREEFDRAINKCKNGEIPIPLKKETHPGYQNHEEESGMPSKREGATPYEPKIDNSDHPNQNSVPDLLKDRIILTIMGTRGGVGKSTITCRMAEMLAEAGKNVFIIDIDTGAAGTTTLFRARGLGVGNCDTVYNTLRRLAEKDYSTSQLKRAIEVTPDYLTEKQDYGRLFLLPAVSHNYSIRLPTIHLLEKIISNYDSSKNDGIKASTFIMNEIISRVDGLGVKFDCIIIDCGAEGAEFNELVNEAHERASLTYIVVQPDAVCRENLTHITHLVTGNRSGSYEKLRIIVNRTVSSQNERTAINQFSDYTVAGCIPDNRQLFEDTQKGTINHRYGYDSLSKSIRNILAHANDFPNEFIPNEVELWIKPAVRSIMDCNLKSLFKGYVNNINIAFQIIMLLIGLNLFGYNSIKFYEQISSLQAETSVTTNMKDISTPKNTIEDRSFKNGNDDNNILDGRTRIEILLSLIPLIFSIFLIYQTMRFFLKWRGPFILVKNLNYIKIRSTDKVNDLERFLLTLYEVGRDNRSIEWLKEALIKNKPINEKKYNNAR